MNRPRLIRFAFALPMLLTAAALVACGGAENPDALVGDAVDSTTASADQPADAVSIELTSDNTTVTFVGSKVTGKHDGGFRAVSGNVMLDAERTAIVGIEAVIDMNSTWSDDDRLTTHLKSDDFFDVANHPTASFTMTSITPSTEAGATHLVTGNFTLRGQTKSITFPATIALNDGVDLAAAFNINRQDFGVSYKGRADDLIYDKVDINLVINAAMAADATGDPADATQ